MVNVALRISQINPASLQAYDGEGALQNGINDVVNVVFFFQRLIERLAKRQSYTNVDSGERGLVMLEIDGLSYHHMKKALADGRLPIVFRNWIHGQINISLQSRHRISCGKIPKFHGAVIAGCDQTGIIRTKSNGRSLLSKCKLGDKVETTPT
jgi:hypothetical protein